MIDLEMQAWLKKLDRQGTEIVPMEWDSVATFILRDFSRRFRSDSNEARYQSLEEFIVGDGLLDKLLTPAQFRMLLINLMGAGSMQWVGETILSEGGYAILDHRSERDYWDVMHRIFNDAILKRLSDKVGFIEDGYKATAE